MPAGGLGREADDGPERLRAPRRLLVRVALTEGLGVAGIEGDYDQWPVRMAQMPPAANARTEIKPVIRASLAALRSLGKDQVWS